MESKNSYPNYRWVIALILFLGLMGLNILWFAPSPLLTVISQELNLNLMQSGLIMSIVCFLVAVFGVVGQTVMGKFGVKNTYAVGLWLMGIGASLTLFVTTYGELFVVRATIGIGFGLCLPVSGSLIMMWFPEKERPYMNTINAVLPYIATTITFALTVPVFFVLHQSWRLTLGVIGIFVVMVAVCWSIWGKESSLTGEKVDKKKTQGNMGSLLFQVLKNKDVRLLSIAEAADMWSFQFLTAYLPTYYTQEVGMDIGKASSFTAIFPVAGILAGLLCGLLMSKVGKRKPFTWPMHLMIFIGTYLAINGEGFIRIVGISLAGFGNAGWAPALFTMPMEFEGMTPEKVGAVYTVMLSLGFFSAFISPWFGGWLGRWFTLHDVIFFFSFSSLLAAVCTFLMKETGKRAKMISPERNCIYG